MTRRPIYFLTGVLLGMALFIAMSCTPEEIRAAKAVIAHREQVRNHPTLVCIRAHESDTAGGYRAQNPTSTASGAYQYLDGTWLTVSRRAGHPGWSRAIHAPHWVQDSVAHWHIHNLGTSAWAGSGC